MVQGIQGSSYPLRTPQELPDLPGGAGRITPGAAPGADAPSSAQGGGFGATLKEFLGEVNDLQLRSDQTFQAFVRGEVTDLHQVALAQQEAGIALRLVTEMRDRLLQAYQEVMRTNM